MILRIPKKPPLHQKMASIDDLKNVLKETLDNRGALNQIRARIRAEVFSALDDQTDPKPVLSNENMFINELIREYLEFNKYKYTSTVLTAESGQPKEPIDRDFLAAELNIKESSKAKQLPILYGLVSHFLDGHHKNEVPVRDTGGRRSPHGRQSPTGRRSPLSNGDRTPPRRLSSPSDRSNDGVKDDRYSEDNASLIKGLVYHAKERR